MVTHENVNFLSKKTYQSKTIWGLIVALGVLVAGWCGYDIAPEIMDGHITELFAAAGIVYAAYGRLVAKKTLD